MKRERSAFLWDMEQACTAVREFTAGAGQDRYANDLMLRSAVERQLQNIGEALTQLAKLDPELAARVPRHRQFRPQPRTRHPEPASQRRDGPDR